MNNAYIPKYGRKSEVRKDYVPAEKVMRIIEEYFGLDRETMLMKTKKIAVAYPRQVCIYFLNKYSAHSLRGIAVIFGLKDGGSVSGALKAIQNYLDTDQHVVNQFSEL